MSRYAISSIAMLALVVAGCSDASGDKESGGQGSGGAGGGMNLDGTGAVGSQGTGSTGGNSGDGDGSGDGNGVSATGVWGSRSGGPFNQRRAIGGAITASNVAQLTEVWSVSGEPMTGTPVIYDGTAYFTEQSGRVTAVNAATGAAVWSATVQCYGYLWGTPLATEDSIYIGCVGRGYALNRGDGRVKWMSVIDESQPGTYTNTSPKLAGQRVIFALANDQETTGVVTGGHGWIAGLDAATGNVDWKLDTAEGSVGVSVWSSAAVDVGRQRIYIGTGQSWEEPERDYADSILAIDYNTGTVDWSHKFHTGDIYKSMGAAGGLDFDVGAEPNLWTLGDRDVVSAGSKGGRFKVLDRDTGEEIWSQDIGTGTTLGGVHATAAIDDDNDVIYVSTNRWRDWQFASGMPTPGHSARDTADVVKLNGATGAELWRHELSAPVLGGGLLLVNDVLFQVELSGFLVALSAGDGSELWRTDLGHDAATAPSAVGDMVFVGSGLEFLAGGGRPGGGHLRAFSL